MSKHALLLQHRTKPGARDAVQQVWQKHMQPPTKKCRARGRGPACSNLKFCGQTLGQNVKANGVRVDALEHGDINPLVIDEALNLGVVARIRKAHAF